MWNERANDLPRICTEAVHAGADFQIVWRTLQLAVSKAFNIE